MTELHIALMNRDDISFTEADEIVQKMKDLVKSGENPENILWEKGFDANYVYALIS